MLESESKVCIIQFYIILQSKITRLDVAYYFLHISTLLGDLYLREIDGSCLNAVYLTALAAPEATDH
jgi:hypothetical protein